MTAKNVVLVLAWATATFVMTLAVFMPGSLDAVSSAVKPEITHPKLTVKGVEFALSLAGGETAVKAGDQPTVEIDVVNPTENVVDLKVDLRMTAVSPMSEDSRSMPMPTEVWKDHGRWSLNLSRRSSSTFPRARKSGGQIRGDHYDLRETRSRVAIGHG